MNMGLGVWRGRYGISFIPEARARIVIGVEIVCPLRDRSYSGSQKLQTFN